MLRPLAALTLFLASLGAAAQENPVALLLQARGLQLRSGGRNPERAAELYQRVTRLVPRSAEAHLRLAEALAELGRLEDAASAAQTATTLAPRNGEAWSTLGLIQYIRGKTQDPIWDQAKTALRRASYLLPNDPDLMLRLAEVCEARKDDALAAETWLRLGRLRPAMVTKDGPLYQIAYERAAILGAKIKDMEARREAVFALCLEEKPQPHHLGFLEEMARDQVEQHSLGHAEDSFILLAKHVPKEPAVFENIAMVQLQTGRHAEALASLEKALALRTTPTTRLQKAFCLVRLGRHTEAQAILDPLLQETTGQDKAAVSQRSRIRLLLASSLLLDHKPARLLEVSRQWGGDLAQADLTSLRIQALIQTGDIRQAQTLLLKGLEAKTEGGLFQLASQVPAKALRGGLFRGGALRRLLERMDEEAMAGIYAENNLWDRCLEQIEKVKARGGTPDIDLILLEANALDQLERHDEAIAVLKKGQQIAPDHPILQNNLGFSLLEAGKELDEAARLIQAALKKEPENGSATDSWGWVLFRQGRFKEAEPVLRKATEMNPYSPDVRRHHAESLAKLGRLDEALEQLTRAHAFASPVRKLIEERLKELRIEQARQRKAAQDAEQAAEGASTEPEESQEDEE